MELNLVTLFYLFFRLAPFIIVCFFSLQSVFNQDFKGVIYLVGLIFACFFTTIVGNIPGIGMLSFNFNEELPVYAKSVCQVLTLGDGHPLSNIPLSQTVLSYTFIYLVYVIAKYGLVMQNIPTLVIFPALIIGDMVWNSMNGCSNFALLFLSTILGGGVGALWAYIIDNTGMVDLQLFNGISSQNVCSRPSKQVLRCRLSPSAADAMFSQSTTPSSSSTTSTLEDTVAKYLNTTPIVSSGGGGGGGSGSSSQTTINQIKPVVTQLVTNKVKAVRNTNTNINASNILTTSLPGPNMTTIYSAQSQISDLISSSNITPQQIKDISSQLNKSIIEIKTNFSTASGTVTFNFTSNEQTPQEYLSDLKKKLSDELKTIENSKEEEANMMNDVVVLLQNTKQYLDDAYAIILQPTLNPNGANTNAQQNTIDKLKEAQSYIETVQKDASTPVPNPDKQSESIFSELYKQFPDMKM